MSNTNDLSNRINDAYSKLSKGQKRLATYITDNYDKAVFLTAAKLGEVVGVSESTVVRFASQLGYDAAALALQGCMTTRHIWDIRAIRNSRVRWRNWCAIS